MQTFMLRGKDGAKAHWVKGGFHVRWLTPKSNE